VKSYSRFLVFLVNEVVN